MRIATVIVGVSLSVWIGSRAPLAADLASSDVVTFSSAQPGEVIVPVFIGRHGPYRFLLDTGSSHTAVTAALAAELGLVTVAQAPVMTSARTAMHDVVHIESLSIGSAHGGALLATAVPASAADVLGQAVDGVVGQDFLSQFTYTLDYRRSRLTWHDESAEGITLPLQPSQGRYVVALPQPASPRSTVELVPDSGSAGLVFFQTARVTDLGLKDARRSWRVGTVTGPAAGQAVTLDALAVGRYSLRNVLAFVVPARTEETCDGLLPLHVFSRVSFNPVAGRIVIEPR